MTGMDVVARLHAAGCVYAEEEAALLAETARDEADLARLVDRRVAGTPLEQLLGWAEFAGLRIAVAPGVFVPRRRTTLLVRLAVRAAAAAGPGAVVVDLCCGTGAVAAAVRAARPDAEVHAADIDPAAVACARRNLPPDTVHEGDLFAALPRDLRGRVDVLVANAPYVPTGDLALLPAEARDHEHRVALDGGGDGLAVQRRITGGLGPWLAPGGTVLVETGRHQVARSADLLRAAGLATEVVLDDEVDGCAVLGRTRGGGSGAVQTA
jgi:release factor glutamine methyltransferase